MVRHQMPPQEMISLKGSRSFLSVMTPVTTQAVILTFFGTQGSLVLAPGMGRVSKRNVTFVVQAQTCELTGNAWCPVSVCGSGYTARKSLLT